MSLRTLWGGAVLLPSKHEGPGSLLGFLGHHSSPLTSYAPSLTAVGGVSGSCSGTAALGYV